MNTTWHDQSNAAGKISWWCETTVWLCWINVRVRSCAATALQAELGEGWYAQISCDWISANCSRNICVLCFICVQNSCEYYCVKCNTQQRFLSTVDGTKIVAKLAISCHKVIWKKSEYRSITRVDRVLGVFRMEDYGGLILCHWNGPAIMCAGCGGLGLFEQKTHITNFKMRIELRRD